MNLNVRNLIVPAVAASMLLGFASAGQAQLSILISDGTTSYTIADGSGNDSDPGTNAISIDSPTLAALFPTSLGLGGDVTASSNAGSANLFRRIIGGADLVGANGLSGSQGFTITISQNGLVIPATTVRRFSSTGGFTFAGVPAGTLSTFRDGIDPGNVLFGEPLQDTQFSYTSSGTALNSGGSPSSSAGFTFNNGGGAYAATEITNLTVVATGTTSFTSTLRVDPADVPEPGTVAMLVGMSISGSAFIVRRRRSAK